MAMSGSMANSWLYMMRLLAFTSLFYINLVSCSSYHDRCALIVPESTPTDPELTTIPFPPNQDGYYLGGDEVLKHRDSSRFYYSSTDRKVLLFRTHKVYRTTADGVYKVEASLILQPSQITHVSDSSVTFSTWSQNGALSFEIEGYWSKPSGKLCMVGSASTYSGEGKHGVLSALIKLSDVRSPSNITSLIRGTMESLSSADDSSYFKPISLLMFPLMDYKYTEVAKRADYGCIGDADAAKSSLALPLSFSFCSAFSQVNSFQLQYKKDCDSAKNCNPFGEDEGDSPQVMSLSSFQCLDDKRSLRFLVEFTNSSFYSYYTPFNPNKTLVAEGSWNSQENQLCAVACRISTPANSLDRSRVEDCSMRLSLRFPAFLSINSTSRTVGNIWSNKTADVSGHFENITFRSYRSDSVEIPGLKYKYTMIDRARKACPKKPKKSEGRQYPDGNPYNMQVQISVKNRKFRQLYGYADLVSVGDKMVQWNSFSRYSKVEKNLQPLNMSYRMSMTSYNASSRKYEGFLISAEGVYDAETGALCMVGCKSLVAYSPYDKIPTNDSIDREIIVDIQFPPLDSGGRIRGKIGSTREKSSPQYFEPLSFSAVPYSSHGRSIWRMDLEIIMALISNTLVCVFVGYQIWYLKKYPDMYPFVSLLMLVILTLGHMIPLVLNFEALFFSKQNSQSYISSAGGWLEANEVIVRIVTMVAFLLQVRLLQLVSSARLANENQKAAWIAERKTLYVSLPLYIAGGLIALSINWRSYEFGQNRMNIVYIDSASKQHSLWMDLRSYAGLILDGFLLPQIILNVFHNSRQNVLSCLFYFGITLVRVVPHGYDLFRAHFDVDGFDWSYMYANPAADYYSTAWDVIIPAGCVVFCGIVYIQQRYGGRCFLPKMLKGTAGYEKVPVTAEM